MSPLAMPRLGRHVVADVDSCTHELLDDAAGLELLLREAARVAGATVLSAHHHRFEPFGASAMCVLSESHISIHTWPELGAATLDAYTCGDHADPRRAIDHVLRVLEPGGVRLVELARGGDSLESRPIPWLSSARA